MTILDETDACYLPATQLVDLYQRKMGNPAILFDEVPGAAVWAGAALIIGAGIYLSRLEMRRSKTERPKK